MTVSVTCPNCGNTVVFNFEPPICVGFHDGCNNCGAIVSGTYFWQGTNRIIIQYVKALGGFKKR